MLKMYSKKKKLFSDFIENSGFLNPPLLNIFKIITLGFILIILGLSTLNHILITKELNEASALFE